MQARYTSRKNRTPESRAFRARSFVLCRTYLENRILKIQKTMKTSEASAGGAVPGEERPQRRMKKKEDESIAEAVDP